MEKSYEEIMELVEEIAEITAANTENIAIVLEDLKAQKQLLEGLSNVIGDLEQRIITLNNNIKQLKFKDLKKK